MKSKLKSSKLWLSIAAFLSSFGMGLLGYFSDNQKLALMGIACTSFSTAIYVITEGKVDAANVSSTTTTINATTNSKEVVSSLLTSTDKENKYESIATTTK